MTNFTPDPNGYISLTRDGKGFQAILEHQGFVIASYTAKNKKELMKKILIDGAISLPSHAVWLGRELERL